MVDAERPSLQNGAKKRSEKAVFTQADLDDFSKLSHAKAELPENKALINKFFGENYSFSTSTVTKKYNADGTIKDKGSSSKRLVVCCDGTWQSSDQGTKTMPSNIARLVKAIKQSKNYSKGGEKQQIIYYQSGVGTDALSKVAGVFSGAFGAGLDQNVLEAYYFICNNYEYGDEIFLFGFSRGAYTVRTLSGLIGEFDILDRNSLEAFPDFYHAYQRRTQANSTEFANMYKSLTSVPLTTNDWKILSAFRKNNIIPKYRATIKVIGVFDTVGSMGIPENALTETFDLNKKQKFRDPRLSIKVENAFHALALDEHRRSFAPTMWQIPEECEKFNLPVPNLIQCWFPGVHINVGGGSSDNQAEDDPAASEQEGNVATPQKFSTNNRSWTGYIWEKAGSGLSYINPFQTVPQKGRDGKLYTADGDDEAFADITLMWMIDRCYGLLEFDDDYVKSLIELNHAKRAVDRKPTRMWANPSRLFYKDESYPSLPTDYACGPIVDSYTLKFKAGGSVDRAPGQYTNDWTTGHQIDKKSASQKTNEYMHPCVRYRYIKGQYEKNRSRGLQKFWLSNYSGDQKLKSPVAHDNSSTGMVWEKTVEKPTVKGDTTLRISEFMVRPEGYERQLMGESVYEDLNKFEGAFSTPLEKWSWS